MYVLTVPGRISMEAAARLRAQWEQSCGDKGKLIVLEDGMTLSTVGTQDGHAKCGYCGRYGALGQCVGCGAPNQPSEPVERFDVTSHGDTKPRYIPARAPDFERVKR